MRHHPLNPRCFLYIHQLLEVLESQINPFCHISLFLINISSYVTSFMFTYIISGKLKWINQNKNRKSRDSFNFVKGHIKHTVEKEERSWRHYVTELGRVFEVPVQLKEDREELGKFLDLPWREIVILFLLSFLYSTFSPSPKGIRPLKVERQNDDPESK